MDDLKEFFQEQNTITENEIQGISHLMSNDHYDFDNSTDPVAQEGETVPAVQEPIVQESVADSNPWGDLDWRTLPEALRPEESRINDPQYYMEQYVNTVKKLSSDDFQRELGQTYIKQLGIENAEEFIKHFKGFQSDPETYVKLHMPEIASKIGISPVLSDEQIAAKIRADMEEIYGKDYDAMYNEKDVINPMTMSAKMKRTLDGLHDQYYKAQHQAKTAYEERLAALSDSKPFEVTDQMRQERMAELKTLGVDEADAISFMKEIEKDIEEKKDIRYTFQDLYIIRNFDKLQKKIYEQGQIDAKKNIRNSEFSILKSVAEVEAKPSEKIEKKQDYYYDHFNI